MAPTIIFRADGNQKIGAGHLMRCLTIAGAQKASVLFVCSDEDSAALVEEKGFCAKVTGGDYRDLEAQLPKTEEILKACAGEKILVVDSYFVTAAYLKALGKWGKTVVLDDMEETCFPVDLVINYNVFADRALYEKLYQNTETALCLGGEYVPLRPEFSKKKFQVAKQVKEVLITTGGGDTDNIGGKILETLQKKYEDPVYHLVTGRFNPHYEELLSYAGEHKNVVIEQDVKDMASLMERCDICISAGGTTVYEVSAVGVPLICFSYAENQEKLVEYIAKKNIAGFAGHYHKNSPETLKHIEELFGQLCGSYELRNSYSKKQKELVDGLGAARIAKVLEEG